MRRASFAALAAALLLAACNSRKVVTLPPGLVDVRTEIAVEGGCELRGAPQGTVLRPVAGFKGRAVVVVKGGNVLLRDFSIDGNREALSTPAPLPPSNVPFARYTANNGVLAEDVTGLRIERVHFRQIAGFAVLASRARHVDIQSIDVHSSGSANAAGRNNGTGGVLFEEGTTDFRIADSEFSDVLGNGICTHSLYTSPRNARGTIRGNRFGSVGRDAIQAGHATEIHVEENSGVRIGFPVDAVDRENQAIPVAIDTAGNVDRSVYANNRFEDVDGKCIDLDGFHDGEVRGNVCVNRGAAEAYPFGNYGIVMNNSNPDMQSRNIQLLNNRIEGALYGGIFVIGSGHRVAGNQLLNLNKAHCGCVYDASQPDILAAGIYLGKGAERPAPAEGNVIEDNRIEGYRMQSHCVEAAPGIPAGSNTVRNNRCADR